MYADTKHKMEYVISYLQDWIVEEEQAPSHVIFLAGYIVGQCEKVYHGACPAAMFSIAGPSLQQARALILKIAEPYRLYIDELTMSNGDVEFWVSREKRKDADPEKIMEFDEDSPDWHAARARLCGIPVHRVDLEYHLRKGIT